MLKWIEDRKHLQNVQAEHPDFLVLAFLGQFSDASGRALAELEEFAAEYKDVHILAVDVQKVKGVHKEFGVQTVPTVLAIENGKVTKSVEGVQSARFYAMHFADAAPSRLPAAGEGRARTVVVYSGPGCPACGQLKDYLRRHRVAFREVDISRDPRAADTIARRSGRMAVPQTDINGRLVVGFDRATLDGLLGIQSEKGTAQ